MQSAITLRQCERIARPASSRWNAIEMPRQNEPFTASIERPDDGHEILLVFVDGHSDQLDARNLQFAAGQLDGGRVGPAAGGVDGDKLGKQLYVFCGGGFMHGRR
jgi:hypothetical protein